MGITTKQKLEFVHAMARRTRATVRQCEALMRYAHTLAQFKQIIQDGYSLSEPQMNREARIQRKVTELCGEITGFTGKYSDICTCGGERVMHGRLDHPFTPVWESGTCEAMFSGATLKIRVPDGGEVVVPS